MLPPSVPSKCTACPDIAVMEFTLGLQESSYGESVSTLGFGSRVSEITLGAAQKHCESSHIFDARETITLLQRQADVTKADLTAALAEVEAERAARTALESRVATLEVTALF